MARFLPFRALALAVVVALQPGCQAGAGPAPTAVAAGTGGTAAVAEAVIRGRALVDVVPLANAEVTVYDPIAKQAPAAPGAGDGVRPEWRAATVRTDAEGNFALPLALRPGQAAEIYVSDGEQSVCAVIVGPDAAVRTTGKAAFGADRPLVVDVDTTTTTGLMLNSLAALGRAAAARRAEGPAAVLAMQAKALDAMAASVGPAAAKLHALAGTVRVATTVARHMVQADPRLPDPAAPARRALLAAGGNPVLAAITTAFGATGVATPEAIGAIVAEGREDVSDAVDAALGGDPGAAGFLGDLQAELAAAGAADLATTGAPTGPAGPEAPAGPDAAPTAPGPGGDGAEEDEEDVDEAGSPGRIDVGVTAPDEDGGWEPPADPIEPLDPPTAYRLEARP